MIERRAGETPWQCFEKVKAQVLDMVEAGA